ncbi:MAG: fused MFS/spermidine synthase [Propionibacteriaceae bacterium]|nr:fused MFS/spermidine synthase [Propionibacteriaceae bacterium]
MTRQEDATTAAGPVPRLIPDRERPGSWFVRIGGTDQSYVDPYDPTYLEFDYVQRIADIIDCTYPESGRITAVHVGGAGMTIPRYIAHTRPTSGQIVLEPDATLTAEVRAAVPLPPASGIKVRAADGQAGLAALRAEYADLVVVDAFAGAQVPAAFAGLPWLAEVRRVLRTTGTLVMNITDVGALEYTRRVVAGVRTLFTPVVVGAEPSTWRGRRFGNVVIAAGGALDPHNLIRRAQAAVFPYRLLFDLELDRWLGGARPFTDADARSSPYPPDGPGTYR